MKNDKMNKYVKWGLLLNAFSITINQFIEVPDFIMYFIIGIDFPYMFLNDFFKP